VRLLSLVSKIISPREPRDVKHISTAAAMLEDNPAYQEARQDILRDIVEQWLGSAPDAKEERERLYGQAHALSQIDGKFNTYRALNAMKDKHNAG